VSAHTKGLWEIEPWMDGQLAIVAQEDEANDGHIVASLGGPDASGNARLFLHSRELLEALRSAEVGLANAKSYEALPPLEQASVVKALDQVRAAIQKATAGENE
jgi:hypothetical protein